ncbi:hypothetical protein [Aeromonas jandaei]|uniref:hypothetical protein n=1 Tax=Aeromonas jandaei TaxID=650 RepID=UPI001ABFC9B4|nr:hypothetical protein [Aeromonas jandaei]QSR74226.1 hypothetical protein GP488_18090 [Aeromonas jandaei]
MMVKLSYMAAAPIYPPAKRSTIIFLTVTSYNNQIGVFLSKKKRKDMATAVGYSPQFAAFNLIVLAVGHHVLQHCYVLTVHSLVALLAPEQQKRS